MGILPASSGETSRHRSGAEGQYAEPVPLDPQLDEFLARLTVVATQPDAFTAVSLPAWPGRAFGGQLAAQALQAAAHTIQDKQPWSLHVYFHAPVKALEPVDYRVERVKDGRTLATRRVAIEQDGRLRATATVLFGVPGEGPTHQYERPQTIPVDQLPPVERILDPHVVPLEADLDALGYPKEALVELRKVDPATEEVRFARKVWMRVVPDLPTDPVTVAATLAYLCDITLGTTALEPHGGRARTTDLQLGAIELGLWFTASARLHEWTLFSQFSAFAGGGHGLSHGVFYSSDGDVAAVAMQNALMRYA